MTSGLRILAVAAATAMAVATAARADEADRQQFECAAPPGFASLSAPLSHVARRLARHKAVTIVAIGSSSTAGVGASTAEASYPSRLEAALRARFPGAQITILNRGVSGEDAREMLARMDYDVRDLHPDLVLWQVGTN